MLDKPASENQFNRAIANLHELSPFAQNAAQGATVKHLESFDSMASSEKSKLPGDLLIEAKSQKIAQRDSIDSVILIGQSENILDTIDIPKTSSPTNIE